MKSALDRRAMAALAAMGLLAACAGENLFTGPVTGSDLPEVEITAPTEGAESTVGEPLTVAADATMSAGGSRADFKGVYEADGATAYTPQTVTIGGLSIVSLTADLLAAPGQEAGTALIIVTVTDQAGNVGADTVTVTITN